MVTSFMAGAQEKMALVRRHRHIIEQRHATFSPGQGDAVMAALFQERPRTMEWVRDMSDILSQSLIEEKTKNAGDGNGRNVHLFAIDEPARRTIAGWIAQALIKHTAEGANP